MPRPSARTSSGQAIPGYPQGRHELLGQAKKILSKSSSSLLPLPLLLTTWSPTSKASSGSKNIYLNKKIKFFLYRFTGLSVLIFIGCKGQIGNKSSPFLFKRELQYIFSKCQESSNLPEVVCSNILMHERAVKPQFSVFKALHGWESTRSSVWKNHRSTLRRKNVPLKFFSHFWSKMGSLQHVF